MVVIKTAHRWFQRRRDSVFFRVALVLVLSHHNFNESIKDLPQYLLLSFAVCSFPEHVSGLHNPSLLYWPTTAHTNPVQIYNTRKAAGRGNAFRTTLIFVVLQLSLLVVASRRWKDLLKINPHRLCNKLTRSGKRSLTQKGTLNAGRKGQTRIFAVLFPRLKDDQRESVNLYVEV